MQVLNIQLSDFHIRELIANVYKCDASEVSLDISPPGDSTEGITATVKADLEGAKRAAKILNAGKA